MRVHKTTYLFYFATASFEVTVNGKLIFSKLAEGSFPSFKEVVSVVRDCSQGEDPKEVKEKEESGCILL